MFDGRLITALTIVASVALYGLIFGVVVMVAGLTLGLLDLLPRRACRPGLSRRAHRDLSAGGSWVEANGTDLIEVEAKPEAIKVDDARATAPPPTVTFDRELRGVPFPYWRRER